MNKLQSYVSSELTHFVGRSLTNDEERYNLFIEIIRTGIIRTRNNNGRNSLLCTTSLNNDFKTNKAFIPDMVCFCDIPYTDFNVHMEKYSHFGISFHKEFMISQGMRPVFYIPQNTIVTKKNISDIYNDGAKQLIKLLDRDTEGIFEFERFLIFHIYSFIKFYDDTKPDDDPDNYYMEREWRGLERIEFQLQDITRIILPSEYIKRFFQDIPDYNAHVFTVG